MVTGFHPILLRTFFSVLTGVGIFLSRNTSLPRGIKVEILLPPTAGFSPFSKYFYFLPPGFQKVKNTSTFYRNSCCGNAVILLTAQYSFAVKLPSKPLTLDLRESLDLFFRRVCYN
jgi:hypothetical protein